ncbi:MAG: hypothetical protein PGN16_06750 [Sphingomonas phyllosphaerae]|uniref:hypothetical protein n=1 Tax=Sphingomonas phyllosphaerae TaxID=257003 RepID=UPI002FF978D2
MLRTRFLVFALVATAMPAVVSARDVVVQVNARSGPWPLAPNAEKMRFGRGDSAPPTIVPFDLGGGKIGVFGEGTTATPDKTGIGPLGVDDDAVDDTLGPGKSRFPSFYTAKILYPANRHALAAIFVDGKGVVVGRPFMVGTGVRVTIPEGAAGLSLGFNDTEFSGNSGALSVTVQIPE